MKGILLAGGHGTRLHPTTLAVSKHLLPIYDKPMVYYSLSILMLAGIDDILIIVTPEHETLYRSLLGDGGRFGVTLNYVVQSEPKGIAEAFLLTEDFICGTQVCLVLGDNIFHGQGMTDILKNAKKFNKGAHIFGHRVNDPSRFGVLELNENSEVVSIEEKPVIPKGNIAVTGLYFFDESVVQKAKTISPSPRGELEISSILDLYLSEDRLSYSMFGRGFAWLDTGTTSSLLEASNFVKSIEDSQGYKIACLEEIAHKNGWITTEHYIELAHAMNKTSYGQYMLSGIDNAG